MSRLELGQGDYIVPPPLMSTVWEHEPNLPPYNCLLCSRRDGEERGRLDTLTRRQEEEEVVILFQKYKQSIF